MPYATRLQGWIRVRGGAGTTVIQEPEHWLDVTAFQGLTIFLSVTQFGGSPTIAVQTSPNREAAFFHTIGTPGVAESTFALSATGLQKTKTFDFTFQQPLAKWLRWTATGTSNFNICFRIWVTLLQSRGAGARQLAVALPSNRTLPGDHTLEVERGLRDRPRDPSSEDPADDRAG